MGFDGHFIVIAGNWEERVGKGCTLGLDIADNGILDATRPVDLGTSASTRQAEDDGGNNNNNNNNNKNKYKWPENRVTYQPLCVIDQALLGSGELGRQLGRRLVLCRGHGGVCEGSEGLGVEGTAQGRGLDVLQDRRNASAEPNRSQDGGSGNEESNGGEEQLGQA
jgi:hypothetical protein